MTQPQDGNAATALAPVKVAMVIPNYAAINVGGAERQLESLCPLLVERGIRPVIVARCWGDSTEAAAEMDGVDLIAVRSVPRMPLLDRVAFGWQAARVLRAVDPDVVHAFGALSQASVAAWFKRRTGTPVITKVLRSGVLGDLQRMAAKPMGTRRLGQLIRDVDAFVAVSSEIDAELEALGIGADRRTRIPNGVDTERFAPVGVHDRDRARRQLVADGALVGPVVVAVGRLVPEKRARELSAHWELVRAEHPDATLAVVGREPPNVDPEAGRPLDVPGVRCLPERRDVEVVYRAADVYVSASVAEGMSNALLEAMASGLPCVVTRVGGVDDLVEHGVNALVVDPEDLVGLTAAIRSLLSDPVAARRLGERARQTVVEQFGLASTATALAEQYRTLAGRA